MEIINVHEAKTHLSRIINRVVSGEEIVIAKAGKPLVKLIPVESPQNPRPLGLDAGKGWISDDFDEPLPDELLKHFSE